MSRRQPSESSRSLLVFSRGDVLVVAVSVLALVVVVGLVASMKSVGQRSESDTVGAVHIHGLGVNGADGSIVIASHAGLLRVDLDGPEHERIGGRYRDMMGFAVLGPDDFLASGHPDVEGMLDGDPGLLGLLRSTDGGLTWHDLSLGGAADLHELVVAGDSVFAWDAETSQLMVTDDLESWEALSKLDLKDLAVDPEDESRLIAATSSKLMRSVDGGRTWEPFDGPEMLQVAWSSDVGLIGVDGDGTLWASNDPGWIRMGEVPGEPQVLEVDGSSVLVAVNDRSGTSEVYSSVNAGSTWSLVFRDHSADE